MTITALFFAVIILSGQYEAKTLQACLTKPVITYRYQLTPKGTYKKKSLKITSGKGVATIKYGKQFGNEVLVIKPKKLGKITVQFTCTKDGKAKTYKQTFRIIKNVNPVASLKIGSVDYAAKFDKTFRIKVNKNLSGKLTVKPAKGWKILNIYRTKVKSNAPIMVKNNQKITLPKNTLLAVTLTKNGKTKSVIISHKQAYYSYLGI